MGQADIGPKLIW